ncbi:MAG: hypothetical protein MJE66_20420 [Proteobacteria bacterium]|nr:hypothetical protein [Pseudomonadota bacterium]
MSPPQKTKGPPYRAFRSPSQFKFTAFATCPGQSPGAFFPSFIGEHVFSLADEDPFNDTALEGTQDEIDSAGNFRHPTVATEINSWVLFTADGTPRAMQPNGGGANIGTVGTGDGAIYVSDGRRDYAVVVAPLGGIRVRSWQTGTGWR